MSYEVVITREGSDWLADVPSVSGAHTFARSLSGVVDSVREVITLMDDLPDGADVDMTFRYDIDDDLITGAARLGLLRAELTRREQEVQSETADAIGKLTRAGFSTRDTAALLGVTAGRVSQIRTVSKVG